jgi:hypothetical protein
MNAKQARNLLPMTVVKNDQTGELGVVTKVTPKSLVISWHGGEYYACKFADPILKKVSIQ